jgi:hypothetical protein
MKMAEKLEHKFQVGDEVTLPGTRIRSVHYVNQFLYNKTGKIQSRGWSKQVASVKDEKIFLEDGVSFYWSKKEAHLPMYKINRRWYVEGELKK